MWLSLSPWILFGLPEHPSVSACFITSSPYYNSSPLPGLGEEREDWPRFPLESCLYLLRGGVEQESMAHSLPGCLC